MDKIINGFNNYSVNVEGQIKNIKTGRKLKQYENKNYMYVFLYNDGQRKCKAVHRLVAEAFIPNKKKLPQINHKDENPKNNNVENLEWCTAKYNSNYGTHNKKMSELMKKNNPFKGKRHTKEAKEKMRKAKLGKPSKRTRKVIIEGKEYNSITQAMQELNISTRKLYKLIRKEK